MFRMEFCEMPDRVNVRVEGCFAADFAEHARLLIGKSEAPSRFVVDLSEVSYIDEIGERVLIWFKEIGVRFTVDSPYSRHICERLQLAKHGGRPATFRYRRGTAERHSHCDDCNKQEQSSRYGDMPGRPSNVCSSAMAATGPEGERLGNSK